MLNHIIVITTTSDIDSNNAAANGLSYEDHLAKQYEAFGFIRLDCVLPVLTMIERIERGARSL